MLKLAIISHLIYEFSRIKFDKRLANENGIINKTVVQRDFL